LNKKVRFQVFAVAQHQSWLDDRSFESKNLEHCRIAFEPNLKVILLDGFTQQSIK